ncbi:MAG: DNA-processing protein DprA [Lachnospiraceae bacterium]|nr:DNA-processing protein DprA [Lachnospiraceae bacterium]
MIREIYYALHCILKIGGQAFFKLEERYQTAEQIYASFDRPSGELQEIKRKLEQYEKQKIHFVGYGETKYPFLLKQIASPPLGLFYKGKLPEENVPAVAMIGARDYTMYGREMAKSFAKRLSADGVQIISGMALGIDGFSHEGAFAGGTSTFAVLGTGVDICYPKRNQWIYEKLEKEGGIISEFEPGTVARPENFPIRNRLISGLSQGVFVIEARKKSGSLITAGFALEQNRDVYVLPGRVGDRQSEGCNELIQQGARLVMSPSDILENLYVREQGNNKKVKKTKIVLETTEKMVYAKLRCEPKHIDVIAKEAGISRTEAIRTLISLEHKEFSIQIIPNYYIRNLN